MKDKDLLVTLSEAAYRGLYTSLVTNIDSVHRQHAMYMKQYRQQLIPVFDGVGIRYHNDSGGPEHREGISHALHTLALVYQDTTTWQDTRPHSVKQHHAQQTNPDLNLLESLAKQGFNLPSPVYRAKWYIEITRDDLDYIEQDDTPWDDLPSQEQTLRLSLPVNRKRRYLSLDQSTREHYYKLAILHKMEPYSSRRSRTTYIAAALEAIGLGWLTPPEGYEGILEVVPNSNKYRPEFVYHGIHHQYGNHGHTPWAMTIEQIEQTLKPYNYKERVANGTAYDPTPEPDGPTATASSCETETETRRNNA